MANVYQEAIEHSRKNKPSGENVDCLTNIYFKLGSYYSKIGRTEEAIGVYKDLLVRDIGYHDWLCYLIGLSYDDHKHCSRSHAAPLSGKQGSRI